jgi:outer membrane immunogenic protein
VLTLAAGNSLAADLDHIAAYASWTGFYAGAHVGYGQVDVDGRYLNQGEFGLEPSDPFLGAHLGYNWQLDRIVLGIEGDISYAEWDHDKVNTQNQLVSADLDWLVTSRVRVGYLFGPLLVFGTVGGAWADGEFTGDENVTTNIAAERDKVVFKDFGLVAGGGAEWALSRHWGWKIEGLWLNFDDSLNIQNLTANSHPNDRVEFDNAWLVWTGVNFHF